MANVNLGTAYVSVVPEASNSISKIITLLGGIGTSGSKVGKAFGNNFTSSASSKIGTLAVATGNVLAKGVSSAMSTIGASMSSAISRYDTLNNFPNVMSNLGISSQEASQAIQKMSDGLTGLPTTLDAGASAVQRFTSVNNDVNKSTDMFLALNNAILAGGASTDIQSSALEQLSQAYSKGKMDMMEWRTIQMAMPAQIAQVAKAMGMSTDELGEGLRGGTVSMEDFFNKIIELNNTGTGEFASFSTQAKSAIGGIGTALTVFQTQVTKGVTSAIQGIDTMLTNGGLLSISGIISTASDNLKQLGADFGAFISTVDIKPLVQSWSETFSNIQRDTQQYIEPMKTAVKGIGDAWIELVNTATPAIQEFMQQVAPIAMQVITTIANVASIVIGWIKEAINAIRPYIPVITSVLGAVVGVVASFTSSISQVPPVLQAVTVAVVLLNAKLLILMARLATQKVLSFAKAWLALSPRLTNIRYGLSQISSKLPTVNKSMKTVSKTTTKSATSMLKYAGSVALLGAGVALIASGFWIMAQACTTLVTAGTPAIVLFVAMVATIPLLALAFSAMGTALTAGAIGFVALGGSILMITAGLSLLITTIGIFAPQLISLIQTIGDKVVAIVTAIGIALTLIITTLGITIIATAQAIGATLTSVINTIGSNIALIINTIVYGIKTVILTVVTSICLIITTIGATIVSVVTGIATAISAVISTVAGGIVAIISAIGSTISGIVSSVAGGISAVITSLGNAINAIVTGVGEAISTVAQGVGEGIKSVCEGIEGVVRGIGDAISGVFTSIFDGITNVINAISSGIGTAGWAIETIATKSWDAVAGLTAFTASATACSAVLGGACGSFGSLATNVDKSSSSINQGRDVMMSLATASTALNTAINASGNAFSQFQSKVSQVMDTVARKVSDKMAEIKRSITNANLETTVNVKMGKLPHFRMEGSFNAETGSVPSVKVDWYKRGGVFSSPSIIGVGEAGAEAVLPLNDRTYSAIAEGISDNGAGEGQVINIALNYKAGDDAQIMFKDLVGRLERFTRIRG